NLKVNRQKAKENVTKAQENKKRQHDSKIKKPIEYQIGDKVLLYETAKEKTWIGKLEDKWKGPFYIYDKLLNGAYKLRFTDRQILKTPINASLLKIYNDRQNWNP
ncbi:1545_t:CDS:1, partial [Funneliformis geosporum]